MGTACEQRQDVFVRSLSRSSKEVGSTVDETSHSGKRRRTRVLRATDVIPPFGNRTPPSDNAAADAEQPQALPSKAEDGGRAGEPLPAGDGEIPAYDLAENILAEQRRAAGRRRRGPGQAEDEPVVLPERREVRASAPDLASQDLLELQRIVAEIVARDIERLCRRPDRPALVGCP
jgi:hypothetical protein